jgi:hypothetical protein
MFDHIILTAHTRQILREPKFEVLFHPAYSPFGPPKGALGGRRFADDDGVKEVYFKGKAKKTLTSYTINFSPNDGNGPNNGTLGLRWPRPI